MKELRNLQKMAVFYISCGC